MVWQNAALVGAGFIGTAVAVLHGVLLQRLMVAPLSRLAAHAEPHVSASLQRLIAPLLHFSTAVWFAGGLALIAAGVLLPPDVRLTVSILVGGTYLFGAIFNFWATRGRHPGWMLLAAALVLIVLGGWSLT